MRRMGTDETPQPGLRPRTTASDPYAEGGDG